MKREEWEPGLYIRKLYDRHSVIPTGALAIVVDPANPGPKWDRGSMNPGARAIILDKPIEKIRSDHNGRRCYKTQPETWEIVKYPDLSVPVQLSRAFGLK